MVVIKAVTRARDYLLTHAQSQTWRASFPSLREDRRVLNAPQRAGRGKALPEGSHLLASHHLAPAQRLAFSICTLRTWQGEKPSQSKPAEMKHFPLPVLKQKKKKSVTMSPFFQNHLYLNQSVFA